MRDSPVKKQLLLEHFNAENLTGGGTTVAIRDEQLITVILIDTPC
jgi:hypothetical protein